jgi:UDP-GlcNAc3NAcA epimerase
MSSVRSRPALRIVTIVGARPQFVKAAVVSRAIRRLGSGRRAAPIEEVLVHTGQHYDPVMSGVFFAQLDLPAPRYDLGVGSGPHGRQTGRMLMRLEPILLAERPDFVLVYGDTTSTLAGALAAAKLAIPVAHVEAGLRSFDRAMPEELNRVLTDRLSALLFCPAEAAALNLAREGIMSGIHVVGDVMFDAFLAYRGLARRGSDVLARLDLKARGFALATVHRQENTDDPVRLAGLMEALAAIAAEDGPLVVPLHPRTRAALRRLGRSVRSSAGLLIVPPLPYLDMIALESAARVILTDSGGVQKEAYFAGVPCVTLRTETEWTETVAAGANVVAGTEPAAVRSAYAAARRSRPSAHPPLYGRGDAGRRIARILLDSRRTL